VLLSPARAPRLATLAPLLITAACSLVSPGDSLLAADGCQVGARRCERACVPDDNPSTGCHEESCQPCGFAHAAARCALGRCARADCEAGWADCDGIDENGCEQKRGDEPRSCGCHGLELLNDKSSISAPTDGLAFGAGDWTVELWIKLDAPVIEGGHLLSLGGGDASENLGAIWLHFDQDVLACRVTTPTVLLHEDSVRSPRPLTPGRWHHVACQRRSGILGLSIDGEQVATTPSPTSVQALGKLRIGKRADLLGRTFPLLLGPTRVSRVARYEASFSPGTVWPIDEATAAQYLSSLPYQVAQRVLLDEARGAQGDHSGQVIQGVEAREDDLPCE
jgi:hypothetical protein